MLAIIEQRALSHGDYLETAAIAQYLKSTMHDSAGWVCLNNQQMESLDLIATKIARILSGNPNEPDHWDDIGGYAALAKKVKTP